MLVANGLMKSTSTFIDGLIDSCRFFNLSPPCLMCFLENSETFFQTFEVNTDDDIGVGDGDDDDGDDDDDDDGEEEEDDDDDDDDDDDGLCGEAIRYTQ